MTDSPLISIIIPCRNEERFIAKCLDSVIANDYPKDKLEVLIVDGMSEDRTREIIEEYVQQYPFIKLLDNPKKVTPCALNIGIKHAKGDVLIRMDSHVIYEKDYISKCVRYLDEYQADNVGGVRKTLPADDTVIAKAIAYSVSHPFTAGNATYRIGTDKAKWVDTVFCFCCRRELFDKVGLFNEALIRGQDREFNFRIREAGGKLLLAPDIVSYYFARSNLIDFAKWIYVSGSVPIFISRIVGKSLISWRNLVPPAFVVSLILLPLLSIVHPVFTIVLGLVTGGYILLSTFFAFRIAVNGGDIRLFFSMLFIFLITHLLYGLGSIVGLVKKVPPGDEKEI